MYSTGATRLQPSLVSMPKDSKSTSREGFRRLGLGGFIGVCKRA